MAMNARKRLEDVRRIALSLPAAEQAGGRFAFSVRNKGKLKAFVWVWMERVTPKKPRVPNFEVIAVRVANLGEKEQLLAANPAKFFHRAALRRLSCRARAAGCRNGGGSQAAHHGGVAVSGSRGPQTFEADSCVAWLEVALTRAPSHLISSIVKSSCSAPC
jgi:hypothetical protein